jgi:hypothetical protein
MMVKRDDDDVADDDKGGKEEDVVDDGAIVRPEPWYHLSRSSNGDMPLLRLVGLLAK